MENTKKVKISCVAWSEKAEKMLGDIVDIDIYDLKKDVCRNVASLFKVEEGRRVVGYYVLRVDELRKGNEGVLVAAAGKAGFNLFQNIMPVIERQFKNCVAIRVYTSRVGLANLLAGEGYKAEEIVMRKALNG